jgi:hypothetical protein
MWVDETSAALDLGESINKYARSTDHLSLNKFRRASDEEFRTLAAVFEEIVEEGPKIIARRSKWCYLATVKPYILNADH